MSKTAEIARLRRELARERAAHEETRKMLADLIAKQPAPPLPIVPWQPPIQVPVHTPPVIGPLRSDPPCMFDNLPPGVYGLVCQCPKCSPRCGINTIDWRGIQCSGSLTATSGTETVIYANQQPPDAPACVSSVWLTH